MKNSFLFPYPSKPGALNQSIVDLHIDLIVDYLTEDKRKRAYILDLLSQFETNSDIIIYRQDVLKDVLMFESLMTQILQEYEQLRSFYERFQTLKYQFGLFRGQFDVPVGVLNDAISDYAILMSDLLDCYQRLTRLIEDIQFQSLGMKQFKKLILEKTNHSDFEKLKNYFKRFIYSSGHYLIAVYGEANLNLKKVELLDAFLEKQTFFKKKETSCLVGMSATGRSFYNTIYAEARLNLVCLFDDVFLGLFDPLYSYNDELIFFEFAFSLSKYYKNAFLDLCFPSVAMKNELHIEKLYDLGLCVKAAKESGSLVSMSANDCFLSETDAGRIIIGNNNTGKTVFLRSVGIAQVLFQAGLCIPAKEASMVVKDHLVTFLSSKEIHTRSGGRFEKEVQQVSQLLDVVDENSLILMNEVFQSTTLESGLEVLYDILSYFTKKQAKWFVVTHLKEIIKSSKSFEKETNHQFSVLQTRVEDGVYYMEEVDS